jgi:dTDP-4-amino-4,6-dideoxygalactose transaminase
MEPIMKLTHDYNLKVIEDTAQAIGAEYRFSNGETRKAGCIGDIGTTSFFPSKNLGCYGDGGAVFSNNIELAEKMRMVANHGQSVQYVHDIIGINSRLDEIQAAILRVKLRQLDNFAQRRNLVANHYDDELGHIAYLEIPFRQANSTHVFHQYTIKVKDNLRNDLKDFLKSKSIPSMIYYPRPLHKQKAFENLGKIVGNLAVSDQLCSEVLSLPIHTEMSIDQLNYITENIKSFFSGK